MGAAAAVVVVGVFAAVVMRAPQGKALPDLGQLPDFTLVGADGGSVGNHDLRGRVWIANFIFTSCPSFCPRLTQQMARVQQRLGAESDILLVSISVDPRTDTPDVLRAYADRYGADRDRWQFLTGSRADVYELVRSGFRLAVTERSAEEAADGEGAIAHSDRFVLVDRDGVIRGYYRGTEDDSVEQLLADARSLAGS